MTPHQAALEMREKVVEAIKTSKAFTETLQHIGNEYRSGANDKSDDLIEIIEALPLPEEPASPAPVAYITKVGLDNWLKGTDPEYRVFLRSGGDLRVPLYTEPPPAHPAPDADVMALLKEFEQKIRDTAVAHYSGLYSFEAIEQKAVEARGTYAKLVATISELQQRARDAEAEVRRLVDGLSALVHCQSPLTRAAMREAAAEIIARKTTTMADQSPFVATAERWKTQAQAATSVISMVRAMIGEMFGPIANIESEEATLLRGPEPRHDGEAILAALQNIQRGGPPT